MGICTTTFFNVTCYKHFTKKYVSDHEGHGHKAIVYKSHFLPLRQFIVESMITKSVFVWAWFIDQLSTKYPRWCLYYELP